MTNTNKILFLNKSSIFETNSKVNIVLSPELYWVRVFDIPISKFKDILKVVPTFFEEFLDISDHKFYVIDLTDNKYLCFAYHEKSILEVIKNSNLNLNQISNIYFAQNEFKDFHTFQMDDKYFIYENEILLQVPKEFIDTNHLLNIDIDNLSLSNEKISMNNINKYISNKSIYILSVIFILSAFINFNKVSINNTIEDNILNNQKEYKLLPTMIQTKSVIQNLEKKQNIQLQLRIDLEKIFNKQNNKLSKVSYKNNKVRYE